MTFVKNFCVGRCFGTIVELEEEEDEKYTKKKFSSVWEMMKNTTKE